MNFLAGSEKGAAGGNLWYLWLNRKDAILHPPPASSVDCLWKKVFHLSTFIHKLLKLGLHFMDIKPYYSWTPCNLGCVMRVCVSRAEQRANRRQHFELLPIWVRRPLARAPSLPLALLLQILISGSVHSIHNVGS